jgi:hypothetical protein
MPTLVPCSFGKAYYIDALNIINAKGAGITEVG